MEISVFILTAARYTLGSTQQVLEPEEVDYPSSCMNTKVS